MLKRSVFQSQLLFACSATRFYQNFRNNTYRQNYDRYSENSTNFQKSSGYLTESKWFERTKVVINDQSNIVCNQLREHPINIVCRDIKYNTWDKFSEIDDIDSRLSEILMKNGHDGMTQIQKHTFDILNRQLIDILGSAETGSGKTIAYLAPLLNNIMKHYPEEMMNELKQNDEELQYPLLLVLAPTRELVNQITSVAKTLLKLTHLRSVSVIGGVDARSQINDASRGCHALIATPGRLKDLTDRGIFSLKYCNKLVIDEADRMLDMGFEPQIREIINNLPSVSKRHTSMFSATFPKSVMSLASKLMKPNFGEITVGKNSGTNEACIPDSIEQEFILTESDSIFRNCFDFLQNNNKKTIVFCNKKMDVDIFYRFSTKKNITIAKLHGDLTQRQRDYEFDLFKNNRTQILVATSVAARGIDVSDIECVINLGLPVNLDDYIHRVGRCGRMGRPGKSITFVDQFNPSISTLNDVRRMLEKTGKKVPEFMVEMNKNDRSSVDTYGSRTRNSDNHYRFRR
uniref:RNA helicase n=1 Tax=Dugesia japonica TaxID=6161 RepID=A4V6K8_DUGJA|nr:putative RNA helicase protein [Dugesia japonica]